MKIISVVGARPNFVKVAPLHRALLAQPNVESIIVHTGQHRDARLSDVFFDQLGLPAPAHFLNIAAGTPTEQTAEILLRFDAVVAAERPDWVLVVGDVTSTLAGALAAVRRGIRVAHVEAGLRSGDRRMPEETNRILTDHLSDRLFVTESAGSENLRREGIADQRIHFVGNVMIDSLVRCRPRATALNTVRALGLHPKQYALLTMHRPANVDTEAGLHRIIRMAAETAGHLTVLFPLHPRTRARLVELGLIDQLGALPNVRLLEPQGYLECLNLLEHAAVVITDSGGIQEETTYLGVPCLTFRDTTERPVTVEWGTNQLIADLNPATVHRKVLDILAGNVKPGTVPPLWDGQAARRIVEILTHCG